MTITHVAVNFDLKLQSPILNCKRFVTLQTDMDLLGSCQVYSFCLEIQNDEWSS
ncbi:MAG: hypothetical protein ACI9SQ_001550 [Rubritalea sp.]|jgi:hypothetical protein